MDVSRKDLETGKPEPIPAASTVRAWLSETDRGDAIADEGIVTLARGKLETRIDARRLWMGVLLRDLVSDELSGYVAGDELFEVVEVDGERDARALTVAD